MPLGRTQATTSWSELLRFKGLPVVGKSARGHPMQQIADWLKRLNLSEYAERFAENGIDISVLPHLTDQDLKEMGVLLGHRRKILAAIGESSGKPSSPASVTAAGAPIAPM